MKKLIIMNLILSMLASCAFKSNDEEAPAGSNDVVRNTDEIRPGDDTNKDSDGDMVTDIEEAKVGRNPMVAELPDIRVRFIQNYEILGSFKNLKSDKVEKFKIDTKVGHNDPDFKYRVGRIFIRDNALKNAANVGKFSTHSWGEVEEHDLSWVKYPQVDPAFYAQKVLAHKHFFNESNYECQDITAKLENTVKLKGNGMFKTIKNLELNFYYYNYETESYELLTTKKIERHFNSGVTETFDVELTDLPRNLLADNYFKKGEFIISEIKDFEIPELETTYQQLLSSVKAKSIPVVYNTPLETNLDYVGVNGKFKSFAEILSALYGKKFTIEENALVKVNQFENSLPDFTYLKEVKKLDKNGKWFVFTNKLVQHYLDHKFTNKDVITLSYVTGHELASQSSEKVFSYRSNATAGNDYKVYPLGNISTNSIVDIQLLAGRTWGTRKNFMNHTLSSPGGSCGRNCIRREYTCNFHVNLFENFDHEYAFQKNYSGELSKVSFVINQDEFPLKDLIIQNKVVAKWVGNNLHVRIDDISKIKEIHETDENLISVKLTSSKETVHDGLKIMSWGGRDWYTCIPLAMNGAGSNGWPLNEGSKDFAKWAHQVNWSRVKRGGMKTISQTFDLGVSGVVDNQFN